MINYDAIYLFVFIFTSLSILRTVVNFIRALLSNPPERFGITSKELIFFGLSLSYFLTYLLH